MENLRIVSLKDFPDLRKSLTEYVKNGPIPWFDAFSDVLAEIFVTKKDLPRCFILLKDDRIMGYYQIIEHELILRSDLTPWLTTIFIDEHERGRNLSSRLLEHGRKITGELGYPKVYLTTDHIQFYEKFGWREIGLDKFVFGRPTKIYEHDTIK